MQLGLAHRAAYPILAVGIAVSFLVIGPFSVSNVTSIPLGLGSREGSVAPTWAPEHRTGTGHPVAQISGHPFAGPTLNQSIPLTSYPVAIAYDSQNGDLYVATDSNNVTVVSSANNSTLGMIPLPFEYTSFPTAETFDALSGYVYVAGEETGLCIGCGGPWIAAINVSTNAIAATNTSLEGIDSSDFLDCLGSNPSNGVVYACDWAGELILVNGTTDFITGKVSVGSQPSSVEVDSGNGELYVTNWASNDVTVLRAATSATVTTVPVGSQPNAITYDQENGYLYVTNNASDNVSVINGATNTVVASIPVGCNPDAAVYDSGDGFVYVADSCSNNLTVINGTLDTAIGSVPVGSYPCGIAYVQSAQRLYVADEESENLTVVDVATPSRHYPIQFVESGLPNGTDWSVDLNRTSNSSLGNTIGFVEANGTYLFQVQPVAGYTMIPPTGNLTVNGTNVTVAVQFTPNPPETYSVSFTESGLSAGAQWAVDFDNVTQPGRGSTVIFSGIPNGTYSFAIVPISNYHISPAAGSVTIQGGPQVRKVNFAEINVSLGASINWATVSGTGFCGGAPFSATVQFFGNATGGSPPYVYSWNFGDGSLNSSAQNLRYTFTSGPYLATLTVTDSLGNTANKSATIMWVSSCPPSTGTFDDLYPVITIVLSLIIGISVGSVAHRITRVKRRAP
jgi:YVTN family beta-propeller protein